MKNLISSSDNNNKEMAEPKFKVTPYEVSGEVDYNRLIKQFGTQKINPTLIKKIRKPHYFLTRGIFFSHRDFDKILNDYTKGKKFYLYTGLGPSSKMHLGHLIPFMFTKYLQDKFNVKLYIQLTDDEKFLFDPKLSLEDTRKIAESNAADILALGFDLKKTEFLLDTNKIEEMYPIALKAAKKITFSTVKAVFGFTNQTNIGSIFFTAIQTVPCFIESVRKKKKINCLIPSAIDQDPHFRVTRDIAPKLGFPKPALIQCKFLPSLKKGGKMSSSDPDSLIYTTDSSKEVSRKINKYAFSGGRETIAEHRKKGGNPDIDVAYQYLSFFEKDDKKLKKIYNDYKSGKLLTSELKKICVNTINKFLKQHQKKRQKAKKVVKKLLNGV